MYRLFSPCTRLYDILDSQGRLEEVRRRHPEPLHEVNLNVSTEDFLSAESAFTYADLHDMLGNRETVAWSTQHAAVTRESLLVANVWDQLDESYCFRFNAHSNVVYALARSIEHLLELCDIVVRLLAVSVVQSVRLVNWSSPFALINAPTLEYLMEQCPSMQFLSLKNLDMDENHCRVLGAFSRPDLEIELIRCTLTSAGASALVEILGRNQGPTKLYRCEIDNILLANGLRGNSRQKNLKPRFSNNVEVFNREVLAIAGVLLENQGLVDLDLRNRFAMSDETLGAVCDSLKTNPTLEVLNLRGTLRDPRDTKAPAVRKSQIQKLVDMMKVNMSIHTIHLDPPYSQHKLFRESVIPYLETNRLRPRLLAIQRTRPIVYCAKVLGRALLAVRSDPNGFWMLLSGNAEVAFPSSSSTIAAAAILPTPTTAAATSTANAASVATYVMSALTTTATGTLPTATVTTASDALTFTPAVATTATAANLASPSAGHIRKSGY